MTQPLPARDSGPAPVHNTAEDARRRLDAMQAEMEVMLAALPIEEKRRLHTGLPDWWMRDSDHIYGPARQLLIKPVVAHRLAMLDKLEAERAAKLEAMLAPPLAEAA